MAHKQPLLSLNKYQKVNRPLQPRSKAMTFRKKIISKSDLSGSLSINLIEHVLFICKSVQIDSFYFYNSSLLFPF